jgi:MFS transporter, FHS family, glucose/mannose:H+ symporter
VYRKGLVFAGACLGMFLFGIVFLSLGTIAVFIQEKLRLDALRVASLASSLPIGMLVGSLFFGPFVDRYGYRILLIICAGLIALAFEFVAYAQSLTLLQVSFFLIGAGGGAINGGVNALAADITTDGKGARLSLLGVFYGIGALGMPLVIGTLTRRFNYEAIISIIGFMILLPVVYFVVINFPEPRQKQGFPVAKAVSMLKEPALILLGMVLFFESALEGIVGNWTAAYLKSGGIAIKIALFALSCQVAAIAIVRLLLSRLLGKLPARLVLYSSFTLVLSGAALLLFATSVPVAILAMICLGAGFAAVFPVILGFVGDLYPRMTGTAFSIVIVLALAGNTLVNYLVGLISALRGIGNFPYIIIVCVVLMALIYGIVVRTHKDKIKV